MRKLTVGLIVAACTIAFACGKNDTTAQPTTPTGAPSGAYGQPPPGYGQPGAPGYGQPGYGQTPPPGYGTQPAPVGPGGAPPAAGGTMAVPGPAAFPCTNDSACGLAHCNTQYGKCAFPCANAEADCIQGAACLAGFCVPKPPGQ